ncbi:biotin--[acetyl-CoA-carboxylase] ligase [Corynebacterium jeikeium]|uniref:biotin--[acetyl-CoA-carboxylase] ligase n=1 Tax=Corynebacterium jeikeium TaxID=38289 RepID=UPI0008813A27|nr:biotin--[acetyl-CoA-carboxylase] ligase [Corynebacterium jeikeium]SCX21962.1 Bifunctional protein BirA [Corynebacterium jeikeium]
MRTPLDHRRLAERLAPLGYRHVEVLETTGSTSTDLADRVRCGEDLPDMSLLMAEEQTAGRGRKGRSFEAPARSQLICSVLLRLPDVPVDRISLLPLLTGLSIVEGIRASADIPIQLKWPNDCVLDGRKLVGILVEAVHLDPHPAIILGFGINYDLQTDELPVAHASSIDLECARLGLTCPSREDVAVAVFAELAANLERWRRLGGAAQTVLPRYRQASATIGTSVRAFLPGDEVVEGTATDIDDDGELLVRTSEGTRVIRAGEIVHLRADGTGDYGGRYA